MPDDGTLAGAGLAGEIQLGPIDLLVNIGASLKNLETEARERNNREAEQLARQPVDTPRVASALYPSSGVLILHLGKPERFRWWEMKRLVVGGQAGTDTPAGVAWVYASPVRGPHTVAQLRDFTTQPLPQVSFYGRREMIIRDEEELEVEIVGGMPGAFYTAVATIDDWPGSPTIPYNSP